jgi:hypothetical protein
MIHSPSFKEEEEEKTKTVKFNKLPKDIQNEIICSAKNIHNENLKIIQNTINEYNLKLKYLQEKIDKSYKEMNCHHTEVEHTTGSFTDNVITCKICGFQWSDY